MRFRTLLLAVLALTLGGRAGAATGSACLAVAHVVPAEECLLAGAAGSVPSPTPGFLAAATSPREGDSRPDLLIAQRVIDRAWGPASDSLARAQRIAGWRSEPLAFSMSALLPGAGQVYSGEGSGMWYALAEAAGWTARWLFQRDMDRKRDAAVHLAGDPADSLSGWSYQRWLESTPGADPSELQALWSSDRGAYYDRIASDPRYLDGWAGSQPGSTRQSFVSEREGQQAALDRRHRTEILLTLNHIASAVDALRAARFHNLPLRRNLQLELRGDWKRHGPSLVAVIERRF